MMSLMDDPKEAMVTVVIPATLVDLIKRLMNLKYGNQCLFSFTAGKVPQWTLLSEGKIERPSEGAEHKHYEGHIRVTKRTRS